MKLTLLGTSAGEGYPGFWCECENCTRARALGGRNIRGNSSAILDDDVLIDMNAHFFECAPRLGIRPTALKVLLVTHPHIDHFVPEKLLQRAAPTGCGSLATDALHGMISPSFTELPMLDIYGNACVEDAMAKVPGLMAHQDALRIRFHRIDDGRQETCGDLSFIPIRSIHSNIRGFAHNYIIERGGKTLLYASDTGGYDPDMLDILLSHRYDTVVMEGTFGLGAECEGHMCLSKDKKMLALLNEHGCWKGAPDFHLTHICPHWAPPYDEYAPMVAKEGMSLGYDGEIIAI